MPMTDLQKKQQERRIQNPYTPEERKAYVKVYTQTEEYKAKRREKARLYRANNKEKIAAQEKKYREKNKEKINENKKKYYEENKDKIKETTKKYNEKNKEKLAEYNAKRWKEYTPFTIKYYKFQIAKHGMEYKPVGEKTKIHWERFCEEFDKVHWGKFVEEFNWEC